MKSWIIGTLAGIALLAASLFMDHTRRVEASGVVRLANPDPLIARGKYLVAFGGCNDCHTPGWRESGGTLPLTQWMTGNPVGFRGAWGTSYPTNVRLWFHQVSESDWLFSVKTRAGHPPMQWQDLRYLTVTDQRAIYRFIRHLGATGVPMPANVPPWREPQTPYILYTPQTPAP
ncbi:MAG TPA: hypothetical protein VGZ00_08985 [Candidatus Baltobacteraceae bacterium]|jgi:hypothetical protein|nr:hypothetical protein [Candidatus Baltobacteraceae bacterium]